MPAVDSSRGRLLTPMVARIPRFLAIVLSILLLVPPVLSRADEHSELVEQGRSLLDRGETDRARDSLARALEIDSGDATVHYLLGLTWLRDDRMSPAIEALEQAIRLDPAHLDARLQLGAVFESLDRTDEAIAQYQAAFDRALPATSQHEVAARRLRYAVATRHAKRGEVEIALGMFEELARDYPDNVLIVYSAAVANLLTNRLPAARAAFEHVIMLDPAYVNAYLNLATIDENEGRLQDAIGNLRQVIALDPEGPAAERAEVRLLIIEGHLLNQQGNRAEANAAFERALELEPQNRVALNALAANHQRSGDSERERAVLAEVTAYYPEDDRARMRLAELHILSGNFALAWEELNAVVAHGPEGRFHDQAQRILERMRMTEEGRRIERERLIARVVELQDGLRADPDDAAAWKELGLLYFRQNAYQDAVTAFENVLRIDPGDRQARDGLAMLYDHLGRFADSVHEYARLVSVETDEQIVTRLVRLLRLANAKELYTRGRHGLAASELNAILDDDPDNQIAHFYLGLIYAEEEDLPKAVDAYREVVRIVPSHVGARMNLAFSYERLNREEDAIDEYRKLLESNPPPEIAETVRRRLEMVQRRVRGVSVTAGYLMSWDSNSNLSEESALEDYRSDLSLNLAYQYKMQNDLRWRFLLSPVYTNYHRSQFDYLNTTMTISASLIPGRYTLVGGYTYRTNASLITDNRLSRMHTVFAEALTRYRMPNLTRPFAGQRVPSNVSVSLSYSNFDSRSSPFFSSYTASAGLSVNQTLSHRARLRLGYSAVNNENKEPIGNDYAFISHGVTIGGDRLMPWGSVNANYGFTWFDYTNPDSFTQFTRHRTNTRHNFAVGANYRFRPNIGFFTTLSWTKNNSNLPVGFILGREDIIEGLQSSSLSNYERLVLTAGMNVSF
jgi:tetratricopeptide (TPR) repeat protein